MFVDTILKNTYVPIREIIYIYICFYNRMCIQNKYCLIIVFVKVSLMKMISYYSWVFLCLYTNNSLYIIFILYFVIEKY